MALRRPAPVEGRVERGAGRWLRARCCGGRLENLRAREEFRLGARDADPLEARSVPAGRARPPLHPQEHDQHDDAVLLRNLLALVRELAPHLQARAPRQSGALAPAPRGGALLMAVPDAPTLAVLLCGSDHEDERDMLKPYVLELDLPR